MSMQRSNKAPLWYISHQGPTQWDTPAPARTFLMDLGKATSAEVKDILIVSAHWETSQVTFSHAEQPTMIYDFGGFPEHYYKIVYPSAGAPNVAAKAESLLKDAGIAVASPSIRGMDHAVWLVAGLMYPNADKRIATMSIMPNLSPRQHVEIGKALAPLRDEGVTILASATFTHNLREFFGRNHRPDFDAPEELYVKEFTTWMTDKIAQYDIESLVQYRKLAPHAERAHPTEDHILPLFVALGASLGEPVKMMHSSIEYGHFSMTSFQWDKDAHH